MIIADVWVFVFVFSSHETCTRSAADSSKVTEQPDYFTGYSWEAMEMLFNLYHSLRTPRFFSRLSVIDEEPWHERTSEIYMPCSARVSQAPSRRFEVPEILPFRAVSQLPELSVWQQYRLLRETAQSWWDAREPHRSNLTTIAEEDQETCSEHTSGPSAGEVGEVPECFGVAEGLPIVQQSSMLQSDHQEVLESCEVDDELRAGHSGRQISTLLH